MERKKNSYHSIDEYISNAPPEVREKLETLRKVVREAAPDAEEKISYQMPAFAQNGVLVYYAAFMKHIGFFPTASGVEAFKHELTGYKTSRGTIQFPLDQPLPVELISRIVRFRVAENIEKAAGKSTKKK